MFKKLSLSFFLLCCACIGLSLASPVDMLDNVSSQLIKALQQNKATIKTNPALVENLARQIVLPHVDVNTMARLALGRDGWNQASTSQRQQFVTQFTTLMIRTYSAALANYTNQTITFYPIRGTYGQQTQVSSKIIQPGGPAIPVTYKVINRNGQWYVYDFSVDGVSLVQSFRSQFNQSLKQGGMTGLLSTLTTHNATRTH